MRKPMPAHTPEQALEHAQRDLQAALRQGIDTAEARAAVDAAETALAQHQQAKRREAAQARQERAQRIEDETRNRVDAEAQAIVDEIAAIVPGFEIDVNISTEPARQLAEAHESLNEIAARKEALADELETVQGRISELEAERAQIAARRHQRNPEDVGRLGFIDLDLQDLRPMADRIKADLDSLPRPNMNDLNKRWLDAVKAARAEARLALAAELERRLLAIAESLKAEAGVSGSVRQRYRPSPALMNACRTGVV